MPHKNTSALQERSLAWRAIKHKTHLTNAIRKIYKLTASRETNPEAVCVYVSMYECMFVIYLHTDTHTHTTVITTITFSKHVYLNANVHPRS